MEPSTIENAHAHAGAVARDGLLHGVAQFRDDADAPRGSGDTIRPHARDTNQTDADLVVVRQQLQAVGSPLAAVELQCVEQEAPFGGCPCDRCDVRLKSLRRHPPGMSQPLRLSAELRRT